MKTLKKSKADNPYKLHKTRYANPHVDENLTKNIPPQPKLKKKKRIKWKVVIPIFLILIIVIPALIIGIWDYLNFSHASKKIFNSSSPASLLLTEKPKTNTKSRTNILLLGYSADDPGHGGAELTDSILILSLDKNKNTGYMLSVPRDLYVEIPGYGHAKINEAFQDGKNEKGKASDGIKLLQKVIENNLGISTQYWAVFDYGAVKNIVDALGGIEVTIKSDDPRGIYDPNFRPKEGGKLKLKNGKQTINGQTALRLTRARGSTYGSYGFPASDFDRTKNQQLVLKGIKAKINWKLVLDPRTNGKIFTAVADNVKTDVKLNEVLSLYHLFTSVPSDQLKPIALNNNNKQNLLMSYRTPSGQSALIPANGIDDFSVIQKILRTYGL